MTTIPADDLATIEHLDFAPPCERHTDGQCQNPAEYLVHSVTHCPEREPLRPWCRDHLDHQMTTQYPRDITCVICGDTRLVYAPSEFILRVEPIGGKS